MMRTGRSDVRGTPRHAVLLPFVACVLLFGSASAWDHPRDDGHSRRSDPDDSPTPQQPPCAPADDCTGTQSPVFAWGGNLVLRFTDIPIVAHVPIDISRTYNSKDLRVGLGGDGWIHRFEIRALPVTDGQTEGVLLIWHNGQRHHFVKQPDGSYTPPLGCPIDLYRTAYGYEAIDEARAIWQFDGTGALLSITDRNGNAATVQHDPQSGLPTTISHAGADIEIAYNPQGRIALIATSDGRSVAYEYDEHGNLIELTDVLGGTTQYAYDSEDRLAAIADPTGRTVLSVTYDPASLGRVTRMVSPEGDFSYSYGSGTTTKTDNSTGGRWITTFDDNGVITSVTDPLGGRESHIYDEYYNPIQTIDANGNATAYEHDAEGNTLTIIDPLGNAYSQTFTTDAHLESVTDPLGVTTRFAHDDRGNLIEVIGAAGSPLECRSAYSYDADGNRVSSVDPGGFTTTYAYDATGNVTSVVDPLGNTTRFTYDAAGRRITRTDPLGNTALLRYDAAGNLLEEQDPLLHRTSWTYDACGRLLAEQDPQGHVTHRGYDSLGRLAQVEDPLGHAWNYQYDSAGRLLSLTYPDGSRNTYAYDLAGRLSGATNQLGYTLTFGYDAAGNLTSLIDPLGAAYVFEYDANSNFVRKTFPGAAADEYAYDAGNRLISYSNSGDLPLVFTYDALGRVVIKTLPDGSTEHFEWDLRDLLTAASNARFQFEFAQDELGRLVGETNLTWTISTAYAYDAAGNLTRITYPDDTQITLDYDMASQLVSLHHDALGTIALEYTPRGRKSRKMMPNGTVTEYSYDAPNHLVGIHHLDPQGEALVEFAYEVNAIGRHVSMQDGAGIHSYEYDALGRLTGVSHPIPESNPSERFLYDATGNRLVSHLSAFYEYDASYRLIRDDHYTYSYDLRGNCIARIDAAHGDTTRFSYDAENHLIHIASSGGQECTYEYGPLGRRLARFGAGAELRYMYAREDIIAAFDGQGTEMFKIVHGPAIDEPLVMLMPTDRYVFHRDAIGSTRLVTDASGEVVATYSYDSFGNLMIPSSDTQSPYSFTGRELEPGAAVYFYRARVYDPMIGRFLQRDPLESLIAVNSYTYVSNDPVNRTDPTGMLEKSALGGGKAGHAYGNCCGYFRDCSPGGSNCHKPNRGKTDEACREHDTCCKNTHTSCAFFWLERVKKCHRDLAARWDELDDSGEGTWEDKAFRKRWLPLFERWGGEEPAPPYHCDPRVQSCLTP